MVSDAELDVMGFAGFGYGVPSKTGVEKGVVPNGEGDSAMVNVGVKSGGFLVGKMEALFGNDEVNDKNIGLEEILAGAVHPPIDPPMIANENNKRSLR